MAQGTEFLASAQGREGLRGVSGDWRDGAGPEVVAGAALIAYSAAVTRFIPEPLYMPANLAAAGAFTYFASKAGATATDMGLEPEAAREALALGFKVAVPLAAVVLAGIALPQTRGLFVGDEVAQGSVGLALYEALIRIPLGTALPEELIFRGALLGLLLRRHSPWKAATISSVLFGMWHVLPTINTLERHPAGEVVGRTPRNQIGAVATAVALTAAAGYGFTWLRYRSRSVVAPVVAHVAINGSAAIGGRIAKKALHLARLRAGTIGTL